jgi:hypothetical protein
MTIVYLKIVLAAALTMLAFAAVAQVNSIIIRRKLEAIAPAIVGGAIRLSLFVVIFMLLEKRISSDALYFYYPQAKWALQGGIWNADFASSYSPLFPYFGAFLLGIWNDPRVFALFALCIDSVGLWFWHSLLKKTITREDALDISMCYALSAPVIINALVGQQQVWIGAALAASIWLLVVKDRPATSAIIQGVTVCVTKILAVLFWPVLFAVSTPRARWLVAALAIPFLTVAIFAWLGSDLLLGLRHEQQDYTSGNLIYYVNYLVRGGKQYFLLYDIITAMCLLGVSFFIFLRLRGAQHYDIGMVLSAISLLLVTLLLVTKKSYANYLGLAYFTVLFVLYKNLPRFWYWCAFALFSVAGTVSPTIWFASHGNNKSLQDWVQQSGWSAAIPTVVVDWTLIALCVITAYICLKVLAGGAIPSYRVSPQPPAGH